MKFIKAGLLLVLLSASSLVAAAVQAFESEQWAMVVLGLLLAGIQVAKTQRTAEPLDLDN